MQEAATDPSTPIATNSDEAESADDAEDAGTPSGSRTRQSGTPVVPAKRRGGRGGRVVRYTHTELEGGDASDPDTKTPAAATPETPKRGRGGFRGGRGGRWKNRGGPARVTEVAIDKEGTMAPVRDDEVQLPPDPAGEAKVDGDGHLQDGREYRVRTFTVVDKGPRRLYMLSTEPARCIGFRDSYLFFQKHRSLFKTILTDEAKLDLIARGVLPHSYKGRAIGVVTARSVFREFGARIVVGGKKVLDDYKEAECRANGDVEGEVAVPDDVLPANGEEYDRNRYVAWFGASAVYHSNAPTVPVLNGKPEVKKKRVPITDSNWMVEHALAASRFNSQLLEMRREAAHGVYDIYTNQMHYPANMQPTHAKWVEVPAPSPTIKKEEDDDELPVPAMGPHLQKLSIRNGLPTTPAATPDPTSILATARLVGPGPTTATVGGAAPRDGTPTALLDLKAEAGSDADANSDADADFDITAPPSTFSPITAWQRRNRVTIDYEMAVPPRAHLGPVRVDGGEHDLEPRGLCEVPDDVAACLPPECRAPFYRAREEERRWRARWAGERDDGLRAEPRITYTAL